jgi:hypothetical protein
MSGNENYTADIASTFVEVSSESLSSVLKGARPLSTILILLSS